MKQILEPIRKAGLLAFVLPLAFACTVDGYDNDGSDSTAGVDAGGDQQAVCSPSDVATTVFAEGCTAGACHDADQPAAGLDLQSAGLADRILNKESSACDGQVLVVGGDPSSSYLVNKLGPNPACGDPMPKGGTALSAEKMACVEGWIANLQGSDSGGGDSGGGDSGGDDSGGGDSGGGDDGGGW